jgi:mRNA-degrading endonuclease YafQ of YafQ-DinJ toxin-antitoxin module
MKYTLVVLNKAKRDIKRYKKKNSKVIDKVEKTLFELSNNPFKRNLRTHKVRTRENGIAYGSRITGDLRVIWKFEKGKIILILAVGGHSGKHSVY